MRAASGDGDQAAATEQEQVAVGDSVAGVGELYETGCGGLVVHGDLRSGLVRGRETRAQHSLSRKRLGSR